MKYIIYVIIVLEDGLKKNFADVSIEYVNCPDLTQEPFNLAAPGKRSFEHLEIFVLKAHISIYIFRIMWSHGAYAFW